MKLVVKSGMQWEEGNWAEWKERYGTNKIVAEADPARIEIMDSRTGPPTVRVMAPNGRPIFLHSSVDPVKEARRLAETITTVPGTVVIVHGFGLGYLVEALLEVLDEKIPLFVVEPDRELLCAAMKARDLGEVIRSERVYIAPSDSKDYIRNRFAAYYDTARHRKIINIGLPGHKTVYVDFFAKLSEAIWDAVNVQLLNLTTGIKLGPDIIANGILNLAKYFTHPGVRTLFNKFENKPAIIVSAGPSLNKNIHLLKEAKGKAVILSVGTAASVLQKSGIEPDFIVTIDPHLLNYEHFRKVNTEKAALITELQAHYMILKDYKGPMFVSGQMPMLAWFGDLIEDKGVTESGGSVANNAFTMAFKMGANPIILVGQDLAYARDGHSHAAGTNWENNIEATDHSSFLSVKANDGGELRTSRSFYEFLAFFESWIRMYPNREYINATEGGAFIEGTKVITLREVLDQYCRNPVDAQNVINETVASFAVPDLEPMLEILKQQSEKADKAITEAKQAMKRLKQLKGACESKDGKQMQKHLKAVRKIYERFSKDYFISHLPEWLSKLDMHQLYYRTHEAEHTEQDDFHAAIADYTIYYEKVQDGAERIQELIRTCLKEAEGSGDDSEQSL